MAWSPGKNFMMTAFMLWMSGNGVHPFSIMITFYAGASPPAAHEPPARGLASPTLFASPGPARHAVYNPIKSALTVNTAFKMYEDPKADSATNNGLLQAKVSTAPRVPRPGGAVQRGPSARCSAGRLGPTERAASHPQAICVLMNLGAMSGALYKMNSMGLLPNTPSDWASFLAIPPPVQFATGSAVPTAL